MAGSQTHKLLITSRGFLVAWLIIVVKTAGSAGVLSLSCARLTAGRVTSSWVKRPLSVSQQGRLSLPSLRGRLNE